MSWVIEHIQFIVLIAGAIAYWFNQRRREKAGEEADYDGDGIPENRPIRRKIDPKQLDPEEAERARRVQEDIRRKILERLGKGGPQETAPARPSVPEPPPVPQRTPRQSWPRPMDPPTPTAEGPLPEVLRRMLDPHGEIAAQTKARAEAAERATRERIQAMEEEVARAREQQRLESERAAALRRAIAASESTVSTEATGQRLFDSLRDPASLRRAIILREVLGPPVGLR